MVMQHTEQSLETHRTTGASQRLISCGRAVCNFGCQDTLVIFSVQGLDLGCRSYNWEFRFGMQRELTQICHFRDLSSLPWQKNVTPSSVMTVVPRGNISNSFWKGYSQKFWLSDQYYFPLVTGYLKQQSFPLTFHLICNRHRRRCDIWLSMKLRTCTVGDEIQKVAPHCLEVWLSFYGFQTPLQHSYHSGQHFESCSACCEAARPTDRPVRRFQRG